MRKRIKFYKHGQLKYIGHLDLQRFLHRIMRKANIPIEYSKGFNPHPITSFAQPLSLGFTSDSEYMDITLTQNMDNDELMNTMNAILPDNLRLIQVIDLEDKAPKAMAMVEAAKYIIELDQTIRQEDINNFMSQEEIIIEKMTKKKRLKTVDIKPLVHLFTLKDSKTIELLCDAGSNNVKPLLIMKALYEFCGLSFDGHLLKVTRHELYYKKDQQFISIIDV